MRTDARLEDREIDDLHRDTPRSAALAYVLFFVSGASALVYQVVWLRLLLLIFGSTLFATSAILSTFMGGLALGAFLAGRSMDRSRKAPLRVYGVLEIGIGIYALVVPALFHALTPVYRAVWDAGGSDSLILLNLAKFAGIAVVLIVPTTLMGASLPVLARDIADDPRRIGGKVGTLYAINTFGAVAGTFFAGFLAIPRIGVHAALLSTAAVNVVIGAVAVAAGRPRAAAPDTDVARSAAAAGPSRIGGRTAALLLLFGASGFGAMVLEVAWTRALALVLGSSVYAFSLMLVAFLIGLAAGGATISTWLRRRPDVHPGSLLAVLFAATGLLAFATVFVFQHLPRFFGEIYFAYQPSPNGWFAIQFLFGLIVMFPATFAFGGIFPAVLQCHARGLDRVAGSVGTVYTANTAGTIFGAASAGFVLIPWLGVQDSVVLVAASQTVLGAIAALALSGLGISARRALAGTLVIAAALFPFARPGWDALLMNSGVYMNLQDMPEGSDWDDFLDIVHGDNVLVYAREGMTASVLVADQPSIDNRYLAVNGKIEASTNADMETQLMCAHIPLLLHDDPKDVLIIGLASAITVGGAATHPVEHIRVVEVEKAMIPAARLFEDHNGRVMDDPRVEISINDARNELEFSDATYDVIVSEPSNPWMTVASNLFTEDFFRLAATRVRPGGLFSQWVQNYYLPAEDLRSIVAAFRSAFRYVAVFETFEGVDLLLLGSQEPLRLDLDRIGSRMRELSVRIDLARVDIRRPADVLPLFVLGPDQVDRFVDGAQRNTDDNARVEFSAPRALYRDTLQANLEFLHGFAEDPLELTATSELPDPETRDRLRLDLARAYLARGRAADARPILRALAGGPLADEVAHLAETADVTF